MSLGVCKKVDKFSVAKIAPGGYPNYIISIRRIYNIHNLVQSHTKNMQLYT